MKIFHLISQHPQQTGSGFYIQNMLKHCSQKGYTNHLLAGISRSDKPYLNCIDDRDCTFISFEEAPLNYRIPGMSDVMPYPSSRFSLLESEQLDTYEKVFKTAIEDAVKKFQPDLIHSHHLWLASSIARSACPDIPMVTSCHSTDIRQYLQHEKLRKRVVNIDKIQRILALSTTQKEQIAKVHGIARDKIDIVGGGFDVERFYFREKKRAPPVHLVYAGKLSNAKGVPMLLRAMELIGDANIHLHLAGSGAGEENDHCLKLAGRLEQVTIHGALAQEDLAELMRQSHIFILPSFFEGLPLVLLEALACGCRIICTGLDGCRELLADCTSELVEFIEMPKMLSIDQPEPEELEGFQARIAAAILKMGAKLQSDAEISEMSVRRVTSAYSWQSVFDRVEKAYFKALKQ